MLSASPRGVSATPTRYLDSQTSKPSSNMCDDVTIDFEKDTSGNSMASGMYIDTEWAGYGLSMSAHGGSNSAPCLFNTSDIGNDPDLGTPNECCSPVGPGAGVGGEPDKVPSANCDPLGNVLIVQNPTADHPDDNNAGKITFYFEHFAHVHEIGFLNIAYVTALVVQYWDGEAKTKVINVLDLGVNSVQTVSIDTSKVIRLEVDIRSGAVTFISFCSVKLPSKAPSNSPNLSLLPSESPTEAPRESQRQTLSPSESPTRFPSKFPSESPSVNPTMAQILTPKPLSNPPPRLTPSPTPKPTATPSPNPTPSLTPLPETLKLMPIVMPKPTTSPTSLSETRKPATKPTPNPTTTLPETREPTPTNPTANPTLMPMPTPSPTANPTLMLMPTLSPTAKPTPQLMVKPTPRTSPLPDTPKPMPGPTANLTPDPMPKPTQRPMVAAMPSPTQRQSATTNICVNVMVDFTKDANNSPLPGGLDVENEWEAIGLKLSSRGGFGDLPCLFNTSDVGTNLYGDPDLGSPNSHCSPGGPGIGDAASPVPRERTANLSVMYSLSKKTILTQAYLMTMLMVE